MLNDYIRNKWVIIRLEKIARKSFPFFVNPNRSFNVIYFNVFLNCLQLQKKMFVEKNEYKEKP